jgi:hypothetical protein
VLFGILEEDSVSLQRLSSALTSIDVTEAAIEDTLATFGVPEDAMLADSGPVKWKILLSLSDAVPGAC